MQLLSQPQLNQDIATISVMHARLGDDLAKSLAYHTGGLTFLNELCNKNIAVGICVDILTHYNVMGDAAASALHNVLTIEEVERMIDYCYRQLHKYNY